ncbi:MAG: biotin/lipoyl-binding protein, partial [Candidatus Tectomicrobia bacterium]
MAADQPSVDARHDLDRSNERPHGRSKRWFILAPFITLMLSLGGYFGVDWWLYALSHVSTDDARIKGTLITVSTRVPGRLVSMVVEQGQRIKQGDLIARIQQDEYKSQVVLRQAVLEAAKSQLAGAMLELTLTRALAAGHIERSDAVLGASRSQLAEAEKAAALEAQRVKADLREKQATVEEAKAHLREATIKRDMASADLKRLEQLYRDGIIAAEQRDQAIAAYDQAVAQNQSVLEARNKSLAILERAGAESRRVQLFLDHVRTQRRKVRESAALKVLAEAEQQRVKMK